MEEEFVNVTLENVDREHLCCIIRKKQAHKGIEAKRTWLANRIQEGHVFRKLNVTAAVFVEYAPLEFAWVPILGENYMYIYCLWVDGPYKGKGYGKALMEYCLKDAREKGKSGVCMLGSTKQKAWLSNQSFAKNFGFKMVDHTNNGYELLAISFDETIPQFSSFAKTMKIPQKELTIFYDVQCPFVLQRVEEIKQYCDSQEVSVCFHIVDSLQKAKELPCVFNNWALFYNGEFSTVNLMDVKALKRILVN